MHYIESKILLICRILRLQLILPMRKSVNTMLNILILAILFNALLYSLVVGNGVPYSDHWRWIKTLLIPYINDEISFLTYLGGDYSFLGHSHLLALLAMLVAYKYFSLNFYFQFLIGLIFYFISFLIIIKSADSKNEINKTIILTICIIYFNITNNFSWFLVVFEYIYLFIVMVYFYTLEKVIKSEKSTVWLYITFILTLIFADAIGIVAIISSIITLLIYTFFYRKDSERFLKFIGFIFGCLFIQYIFIKNSIDLNTNRMQLMNSGVDLNSIFISLKYCLVQSIVDFDVINYYFRYNSNTISLILFAFVILVIFFFLFSQIRYKLFHYNIFPLLLFIFGSVSIVGIFITRIVEFGSEVFLSQRYSRYYSCLLIACVIGISYNKSTKIQLLLSKTIISLVMIVTILFYFLSSNYQWKFSNTLVQYVNELGKEIILYSNTDKSSPTLSICNNNYCGEAIQFLRKNHLSIFKYNYTITDSYLRIDNWGPKIISIKKINLNINEHYAIWLTGQQLRKIQKISVGNTSYRKNIVVANEGKVLTFILKKQNFQVVKILKVTAFMKDGEQRIIGSLKVTL